MGIDIKTLALAKKYTKDSLDGVGAIAGKNCTIDSITDIPGGHRVVFKWIPDSGTPQTTPMDVMDGEDGEDGASAYIVIEEITGGHRLTVTSAGGEESFDVMDGEKGDQGDPGEGVPAGGNAGQVLAKKTNDDYDTEWVDQSGGGGGTTNYNALSNKPQIEGVELSGNKTAADLGLVTASALPVVPTDVSAFNNDAGYITNSDITGKQNIILASAIPVGGMTKTTVEDALEALADKVNSYGTAAVKDVTTYVNPSNHDIPDSNAIYQAMTSMLEGAFHPAGNKTVAELTSTLLIQANVGNVYRISDSGVTTADWVGGAGQTIEAGQMAVVVYGNEPNTFLFNLEPGINIDMSAYQTKILASTLTIGGQVKTNVEDALGALNDVKADASAVIAKSSTAGLMKNDGTVDETHYVSDVSGKQNIILASVIPIGGINRTTVETALRALNDAKAEKVSSAVSGNLAGLDANGNPTDSGIPGAAVPATAGAANKLVTENDAVALSSGAGSRNAIFRGSYLGSAITAEQLAAIAAGTFEGLMLGDYWTIDGVNYRIAAFDYWLHDGNTECTDHHIVVVPDTNLYTAKMNDSDITTGGYAGSKMFTANLATAKTTINAAFGSSHILSHKELFTKAVTDGKASSWDWYDSTVDLMNECMVYGHNAWGSHPGYETGIDKTQLPLFAVRPDLITNRAHWWLRSVVSGAYFALVNYNGDASTAGASGALGVRPAFAIF